MDFKKYCELLNIDLENKPNLLLIGFYIWNTDEEYKVDRLKNIVPVKIKSDDINKLLNANIKLDVISEDVELNIESISVCIDTIIEYAKYRLDDVLDLEIKLFLQYVMSIPLYIDAIAKESSNSRLNKLIKDAKDINIGKTLGCEYFNYQCNITINYYENIESTNLGIKCFSNYFCQNLIKVISCIEKNPMNDYFFETVNKYILSKLNIEHNSIQFLTEYINFLSTYDIELMKDICDEIFENKKMFLHFRQSLYYYKGLYCFNKSRENPKDVESINYCIEYLELALKYDKENTFNTCDMLCNILFLQNKHKNIRNLSSKIPNENKEKELDLLLGLFCMISFYVEREYDYVYDEFEQFKKNNVLINNGKTLNIVFQIYLVVFFTKHNTNSTFDKIQDFFSEWEEAINKYQNSNEVQNYKSGIKLYNYYYLLDEYIQSNYDDNTKKLLINKFSELNNLYDEIVVCSETEATVQTKIHLLMTIKQHIIHVSKGADIIELLAKYEEIINSCSINSIEYIEGNLKFTLYEIYKEFKDNSKIISIVTNYKELLLRLEFLKNKIRIKTYEELQSYAHYGSIATLDSLIDKNSKIRLSHVSKMNDPEEGKVFLKLNKSIDNIFKENIDKEFENAFFMCFCKDDDDLTLFRLYGDNSNGCSIKLSEYFFAKNYIDTFDPFRIEFLKQIHYSNSNIADRPFLYKVVYIDRDNKNRASNLNNNILKGLKKIIDDICKLKISALDQYLYNDLYHIRYLFKYSCWETEKEARIIISPQKNNIEEIDKFLYTFSNRKFKIKKVTFGSKVNNFRVLQQYYLNKGIDEVKKTKNIEV